MKSLSAYVLTIALACGATVLLAANTVHRSAIVGGQASGRMEAPFRDGLFLGRRDVDAGRKQHLITGRWSDEADRRLFVTGYLQAYREKYGPVGSEEFGSSQPVEQAGYRDGLADGFKDRLESKRFRAGGVSLPSGRRRPEPVQAILQRRIQRRISASVLLRTRLTAAA
jgi:hypothetical protein